MTEAAGIAQRLARAPPSRLERAGSARYGTVNTIAGSAPMRIFFGLAHSPTRLLGRTILHRSLRRRVRARGEGKVGQLRWSGCLYFCCAVLTSRLTFHNPNVLSKVVKGQSDPPDFDGNATSRATLRSGHWGCGTNLNCRLHAALMRILR
jgi:hypothetical protein